MSWTPRNNVTNKRQIAGNLLAFFKTNNADALLWASPSESLKPFIEFADSVGNRDKPNLPSLAFADDDDATDYTTDLLQTAYRLNFEAMIENPDPNVVVRQARKYIRALESMTRNIGKDDLLADTGVSNFTLETIETGFEQVKANKPRTSFMQKFEIRITYTLRADN
jgi:hypothetical protein